MTENKIDEVIEKADELINAISEQKEAVESKLVSLTARIDKLQAEVTELVHKHEFKQAAKLNETINQLLLETQQAKDEIVSECITVQDVKALREIEPKRKSVQNMLETEVAATPKFEKLLNEELGEKSPYQMRIGNNEWLKDESRKVPVIEISEHDTNNIIGDMKSKNIKRGNFINNDTGLIINVGSTGILDTLNHAIFDSKRHIPIEARLSALYHAEALVNNAVCLDTKISEAGKNKASNTLFMHKMYLVLKFKNDYFLANLSVEESYSTDKNDKFKGTSNRFYNLKDIKITPVELEAGFQSHGMLPKDNRAKLTDVTTISIPQLYNLVKTYDKNFFENPSAIGRAERLKEIKRQTEYIIAVKLISIMEKAERRINIMDEHKKKRENPEKGVER